MKTWKLLVVACMTAVLFDCGGGGGGGGSENNEPASQVTVSTLAGSGTPGFADGTGAMAQFYVPIGVAVDAGGNVYVADSYNNRIRKITPTGVVSTLAGSGAYGFADGTGTAVQFKNPQGVAVDAVGNVYVADTLNNSIRKVTPAGLVSTLGVTDGTTGAVMLFNYPTDVAVDAAGNIYVADYSNNSIRKITPAGVGSTLAGSTAGFANGAGATARFNNPAGVAVDTNVYVADQGNNSIRKITPTGVVSTLAGGFKNPQGIAVDAEGNVYVADTENCRIRKITPAGMVSTLAGSICGFADGTGSEAEFYQPTGVAVDAAGNVYVADFGNSRIRKITVK
ncbi:MAG: NHL repeat-containing protein [Desulfuromonadales bacterium]|nr:NHL repeat-containing protein [Desulfuromonadales bacterium]